MATIQQKKQIYVYAHWQEFETPQLMGVLSVTQAKGKETFAFEYAKKWIQSGFSQMLDPDLELYSGAFYPRDDKPNFGMFLDSSPDRWGKVLMQRREAAMARQDERATVKFLDADFLLGVFDHHRMGALRFKIDEDGEFLNNQQDMAAPPWNSLRELEQASLRFEEDNTDDPDYLKWVNLLIAPGSSLGGARPKASVIDTDNNLWIAKFPSRNDDKDVAAWEMVVNELAVKAGLNVADGRVQKFANKYHTYLTKRFDRTNTDQRKHFASAMTLLGYTDGEGSVGAGYLDMVTFITKHGANVNEDLEELWRRIVFNICVSNTDDHLRNHGFLLTNNGWRLSPAYDINPNEYGGELSLNISQDDNNADIGLAKSVATHFRLSNARADVIVNEITGAVKLWSKIAEKYKISRGEQQNMSFAFKM